MAEISRRLIRDTGWAFRLLGLLIGRSARRSGPWSSPVFCFFVFSAVILAAGSAAGLDGQADGAHHHHSAGAVVSNSWEGSAQGIAYSETNHHLSGILVLLIGLSELRQALGLHVLAWTRLLLPLSLVTAGVFLLIWSDHDAWPIGSLTLAQTLSGQDPEMLQHKTYGVLALAVGAIELLRRLGPMRHSTLAIPLPLFAIVGGLMLFGHSHGDHPAAYKIQLHHTVMGLLAITAGSSKLVSSRWRKPVQWGRHGKSVPVVQGTWWEFGWAGLILLIGLQLLFYSE
jgi:putative copper resistance protein D